MGARLEGHGQIRNIYPYMVRDNLNVAFFFGSPGSIETKYVYADQNLPFDRGPDKSSRVFMCFNGLFIQVSADAYTPNNPRISGLVYYTTPEGRKIYLTIIDTTFSAAFSESNPSLRIMPDTSFNAGNVPHIGIFGFENRDTSMGSATTISFRTWINVGFYADYAEPDWNTLFTMQQHEHSGLPVELE